MRAHTPGPWIVDGESKNDHQAFIIEQDRGEERGPKICWTATRGYDTEQDRPAISAEDEANAHLIAAAPDLLVALKQCIPLIEAHANAALGEGLTLQVARAAIAKAEGRNGQC